MFALQMGMPGTGEMGIILLLVSLVTFLVFAGGFALLGAVAYRLFVADRD